MEANIVEMMTMITYGGMVVWVHSENMSTNTGSCKMSMSKYALIISYKIGTANVNNCDVPITLLISTDQIKYVQK